MEQKLIEAKFKKNNLTKALLITGTLLIIIGFGLSGNVYDHGRTYAGYGYGYDYYRNLFSFARFLIKLFFSPFYYGFEDAFFVWLIYAGALFILLAGFFWWQMSKWELSITDRRVVGKASFGRTVDLPLNQISAVALGIFSRITVATSSGKVRFWFIKNRSEVYSTLTNIIGKVQVESAYFKSGTLKGSSDADELKKFKELLEDGVITQEEFDKKKKQLLGL